MTDFATQVQAFVDKAKGNVDKQVRGITLSLFRDVILSSPVGNPDLWKHAAPKGYSGGRFRANWNVSIGSPDESTSEKLDPSGIATVNLAAQNIGGAGSVTFMTNALPYAERLEYESWSKQAPMGFVRVNMARIADIMKEET